MSQPALTPIDLDASSLRIRCRQLRVPQTHHRVPVLGLEGGLGQHVPLEQDLHIIRWGMDELHAAELFHCGMLLDARALVGVEALSLELFPAKVRRRQEPHGILVRPGSTPALDASFPAHIHYEDLDAALGGRARGAAGGGASAPLEAPLALEAFAFSDSSTSFHAFSWSFEGKRAAWARVEGTYRRGSAGDDDAHFIRWRVRRLYDALEPALAILDLRGLDYVWGDKLHPYPPRPHTRETTLRFVVEPPQLEAYLHVLEAEHVCTSTEEALEQLCASARPA